MLVTSTMVREREERLKRLAKPLKSYTIKTKDGKLFPGFMAHSAADATHSFLIYDAGYKEEDVTGVIAR